MTIKRRLLCIGIGFSEQNLKDCGPHFQMYLRSWWGVMRLCVSGVHVRCMYMYVHTCTYYEEEKEEAGLTKRSFRGTQYRDR